MQKSLPILPLFVSGFVLATAIPGLAQTVESSAGPLRATVLAEGLDHPWALAFLPDGRFLVTERSGRLVLIESGVVSGSVEGVPNVVARGQGGLLDLALAPDFETSGKIYLTYAEPAEDAGLQRGTGTAVMAAKLVLTNGGGGQLEDQKVIFRMNNFDNSTRHFGSRIAIAPDGNLFVTLGERGSMERAQDPMDLAGGIVRIAPDGSVPEDNPKPEGWAPEFWSIGHRNPQGATIRPDDGVLFTVEHGARGGDEVNMPTAGDNFGWPIITYGVDYSGVKIGEGTEKGGWSSRSTIGIRPFRLLGSIFTRAACFRTGRVTCWLAGSAAMCWCGSIWRETRWPARSGCSQGSWAVFATCGLVPMGQCICSPTKTMDD